MLDARPAPDALARPPLPSLATEPPASPERPAAGDAHFTAARTLLPVLEAGKPLDAATLRDAMTNAFGASDAEGAWLWKDAYEAAEAALVLFLQRYGRAMRREAGGGPGGPAAMLRMLETLAALEPSQTRRSEEQLRLQQFSTPLPLAYAALQAAMIRPGDVVLEPSAGTGMLAIMVQLALGNGAADALHLNEIAPTRAGLLAGLFPGSTVTRHNAESIRDHLPGLRPTVVLMNPPFSASPGVDHHPPPRGPAPHPLGLLDAAAGRAAGNDHLFSLRARRSPPGRTPSPSIDPPARVVFTMAIDGRVYARRGTGFDTRLTVIDRPAAHSRDRSTQARVDDAAHLLDARSPPPCRRGCRHPAGAPGAASSAARQRSASPLRRARRRAAAAPAPSMPRDWGPVNSELASEDAPAPRTPTRSRHAPDGPYEPWRVRTMRRSGRRRTPDAAGAVRRHGRRAAPAPSYRPMLPERVVTEGPALRRPARERRPRRPGARGPPRRGVPHRRRLGDTVPETVQRVDTDGDDEATLPPPKTLQRNRRCRRAAFRSGPVPPRLDAGRRHRLRQGPPGRRDHPRQLAERDGSARSGSRCPTSCSRTRAATGPRSAGATTT